LSNIQIKPDPWNNQSPIIKAALREGVRCDEIPTKIVVWNLSVKRQSQIVTEISDEELSLRVKHDCYDWNNGICYQIDASFTFEFVLHICGTMFFSFSYNSLFLATFIIVPWQSQTRITKKPTIALLVSIVHFFRFLRLESFTIRDHKRRIRYRYVIRFFL